MVIIIIVMVSMLSLHEGGDVKQTSLLNAWTPGQISVYHSSLLVYRESFLQQSPGIQFTVT